MSALHAQSKLVGQRQLQGMGQGPQRRRGELMKKRVTAFLAVCTGLMASNPSQTVKDIVTILRIFGVPV